jgi:iron complex outermembrane receptor protein
VEGERDSATGKFIKLVNNNGVEGQEIATDEDFKSSDPRIPRQRIQHSKIVTDNSFNIGKDRLTVTLGYQRNQRQEFGDILAPNETQSYFDLGTFNYNFQYHFSEQNNWRTSIGLNGMQQKSQNKGEEALIPEHSLFDIGGFIYSQKTIQKLTLSGGLRFDNRSIDSKERKENNTIQFASFKKSFADFSGSVGLSYEASDLVTWKFNIARGYRAPNLIELASNGVHEGTSNFLHGNLGLKPESSFQTDAGMIIGSPHVSLEINAFYNHVQNFIFLHKLESASGGDSVVNVNGDNFTAFQFGGSNAYLYGTEFNLDIHPHPLDWLHIENTFSWVRGKFDQTIDGSSNLPFIPAVRLLDVVKVDFSKQGQRFRNGFVKVELDNTFAQNNPFTGFNTETGTPGYSLLNAALGADIVSKSRTLFSFLLAANNISDVAYQSHLSRLKYLETNNVTGRQGIFNMGRNFSVKVNVPLQFQTK